MSKVVKSANEKKLPEILKGAEREIPLTDKKTGKSYTVKGYLYTADGTPQSGVISHYAALCAVSAILKPIRELNQHYRVAYADIARCISTLIAYLNTSSCIADLTVAVSSSAPQDANAIDLYGAAICAIFAAADDKIEIQRQQALKSINSELWQQRRARYEQMAADELVNGEDIAAIVRAYIAAEYAADNGIGDTVEIVRAIYDIAAETKRGIAVVHGLEKGLTISALARLENVDRKVVYKTLSYIRRRLCEIGLM